MEVMVLVMNRFRMAAKWGSWTMWILLSILLISLGWNYLRFQSRQLKPASITKLQLDKDTILEKLRGAIQIPTISTPLSRLGDDSELHRFRDFIHATFPDLHESPFVVRTGRDFGDEQIPSILLEWPGQEPGMDAILLMSHFDVVPIEASTRQEWSHPAFSGDQDGKYLWGRGTLDCKQGVMAILEAIHLLSAEGFKPQRTIYVALGHDEEIGGAEGNAKMSAWFKSQGRRLHSIIDEGGCIFNEFPGLKSPAALVGVAEKGYLVVELTASVEADQVGHASMPPRETAVSLLANALHRIHESPFPARVDGGLQKTLDFLGPEMDFTNKIAISNMWLFGWLVKNKLGQKPSGDALLRTTIAPTMIEGGVVENVLPSKATAKLNLRLLPGDTVQSVMGHLERGIKDPRVTVSIGSHPKEASTVSDTDGEPFKILQETIHQVFPDVVVAPFVLVGSTDTSHYLGQCDNIFRFIPTRLWEKDTQRFHGIDERIECDNYLEIVRFFHQYIKNSSRKDESQAEVVAR